MDGRVSDKLADWPEVILDLRRHAWTITKIAKAINVPRTTVEYWSSGGEPRYTSGAMLLALHTRVLSKVRR